MEIPGQISAEIDKQPLAVAIISGLIVQLPLVLLVMPALYILMVGLRNRLRT